MWPLALPLPEGETAAPSYCVKLLVQHKPRLFCLCHELYAESAETRVKSTSRRNIIIAQARELAYAIHKLRRGSRSLR